MTETVLPSLWRSLYLTQMVKDHEPLADQAGREGWTFSTYLRRLCENEISIKPGAFRQYRFREDLFPRPVFRRAHDQLQEALPDRTADLEYLRILRQAARTMESEVERVLVELERLQVVPRWAAALEFWPQPLLDTPELRPLTVPLESYDPLLQETAVTP